MFVRIKRCRHITYGALSTTKARCLTTFVTKRGIAEPPEVPEAAPMTGWTTIVNGYRPPTRSLRALD